METMVCIDCKIEKPLNEFHRHSTTRRGHRQPCRLCVSKRAGRTPHRSPLLPTMVCTKCGIEKDLECFYREPRNKNGHGQPCIDCNKAAWRAKREALLATLPPKPIIPEGMKRCSQCNNIKPLEEFYRHRGEKDGRSQPCKTCNKPYEASYRANNQEAIKAYDVNYRQRNGAKVAAKQKATKAKNASHIKQQRAAYRKQHQEQLRLDLLAWTRAHPEKVKEYGARRRAKKLAAAINDLTASQWKMIKEMYKHRCVYCGKKFQRLSQDHIIPLSQGGNHTFTNVVPACRPCNSKKNAGPPLTPVQPLLLLPTA